MSMSLPTDESLPLLAMRKSPELVNFTSSQSEASPATPLVSLPVAQPDVDAPLRSVDDIMVSVVPII